MERLEGIVIGIFISVTAAGILYFINWIRKPWLIPHNVNRWSEETLREMRKVGWEKVGMKFVLEPFVVQEENRGFVAVKAKFPPRVVKAEGRDGDVFVMMKKSGS